MVNKIIVALGNPETQHEKSRHNAGWLAVDKYIEKTNWQKEKKFNSLIARVDDKIFIKPLTYMNLSGNSVFKIMNYYKLMPKKFAFINKKNSDLNDTLIVIHDDIDIDLGEYKIVTNSSSAGHRGVQSIINRLNTQQFTRLRLGIKTSVLRQIIPAEKFVLQKFSDEELTKLYKTIDEAWPKLI